MTKPITQDDINLAMNYVRQEMETVLRRVSSAFGHYWKNGNGGFFVCEKCRDIERAGLSSMVFYRGKEIHVCLYCSNKLLPNESKRIAAFKKKQRYKTIT